MKNSFLRLFSGFALLSSSAFATELTCQSVVANGNGNYSQLEAAGSCDIGNVTFSGFTTSYNPSSVVVAIDGYANSPVGSILGLTYSFLTNPGNGTFGYTATFDSNVATDGAGGTPCPAGDVCGLVGVEAQLFALVGNGAVISTSYTGGLTKVIQVDSATLGDETSQTVNASVVPPAAITEVSTYNGTGTILSFTSSVITQDFSLTATPEPATFGLIGLGLFGLGLIGRKKLSRQ